MDIAILEKYFSLNTQQKEQFELLEKIFLEKNQYLNLVSRKDTDNLVERHFLHSLTIARYFDLNNVKVLDVGTGGGFPGLPLAIFFPNTRFTLVDATRKKMEAVREFVETLGLKNVDAKHIRAEELKEKFDFVVSRAVTSLDKMTKWVEKITLPGFVNGQAKGIIYLRGLDFDFNTINKEISQDFDCNRIIHLEKDFELDFFLSKKIVFLQRL